MTFLWGFLAGIAMMIVAAIAFSFVVFLLTPDEMEDEFALRVRDLPGSTPNLARSTLAINDRFCAPDKSQSRGRRCALEARLP